MQADALSALVELGMPELYGELVSGDPMLIYRSAGEASPNFAIAARNNARATRIPEYKLEVPLVSGGPWASRTLTGAEADALKATLDRAGVRYVTEPFSA